MSEFSSWNHFLPRSYLKRWSSDGIRVAAYSLLVPDKRVPPWPPTPVKALAAKTHLYTSVSARGESDAIERWLNRDFENPAQAPLRRAEASEVLSGDDRRLISRYAMALDVRTPLDYIESRMRWLEQIPRLTESLLGNLPDRIASGRDYRSPRPPMEGLPLKVRLTPSEEESVQVEVEWMIGRELWLARMRHVLTQTVSIVPEHNWVTFEPASGCEWFTSDVPVLKLNYYKDGTYDFRGGWGNPGTEILLPLSPRCLLYCQIGRTDLRSRRLDRSSTFTLQRLLAERAFREIYSRSRQRRVEWWRPRVVDLEASRAEAAVWEAWHASQTPSPVRPIE